MKANTSLPRPPSTTAPLSGVVEGLGTLGDETRLRILLALEQGELNVGELAQALQLGASSVSRHLRTLEEGGWVRVRSEGTARVFRLASLSPGPSRALWRAVGEPARRDPVVLADAERAAALLAERRERSRAFFRTEGGRWDTLRTELFGSRATLLPLVGLLDPAWVVGDLGCGTGALAAVVAPAVRQVVAVDREARMLEAARERLAGAPNVVFHEAELQALPVDDGALDMAFLVLVLHLVPDPPAVMAEAARTLAPGGRLVVCDMRAHDRDGYRTEMGHLWTGFDPDTLAGWLEQAGLEGVGTVRLPPEPGARGPLLFTATGRRPRRGRGTPPAAGQAPPSDPFHVPPLRG